MCKSISLIQALLEYHKNNYCPFHMPGHKQGAGQPEWFKDMLGAALFSFDLTELPGLDDLHQPLGTIQEAQKAAARCFGAEETFFLINGSTVGILAMLIASVGLEDVVLIPRQAHRSIIGGVILSGARPKYLMDEFDPDYKIPLAIKEIDLQNAMEMQQEAKCLLLVHPNYYGIAGNILALTRIAQTKDLICIADEAHAPHFHFHKDLPITALKAGVDASTQSLHKTLSSLTQTALLHRQGKRLDQIRLKTVLSMLQSTSPSYILMASLDASRIQMEEMGRMLIDRVMGLAEKARTELNKIPGLSCLGKEVMQRDSVGGWDPTKLVINVEGLGLSGFQAADILRKDYRIQVEMADCFNVLAMVTIGDTNESIDYLLKGFKDLGARWFNGKKKKPNEWCINLSFNPEVILTPREAFFWKKTKRIRLEEAAGELSAELFCPYPPGVPLLVPGEKVTEAIIERIRELKKRGSCWHGPADPDLNNIQVLDF